MRLFQPSPDSLPNTCSPPLGELRIDGLPRRKARRYGAPCTVALHHIDNRRQHTPPMMRKGSACPLCRREQGGQPTPHHVDQRWWLRRFFLLVRRRRVPLPLAISVISRPGVVPPAPPRPRQDARRAPLYPSHKLPEQPSDFGSAQADRSPWCALKRDKLVFLSPCPPVLGVTAVPVSARTTAKNACAHIAKVMWRYHPVQLRTS
jgi:hypothetical protein